MTTYLDSSAIVKRYVAEAGSDIVEEIYEATLNGEQKIAFSAWNIGEVLGVLDRYYRRKWLYKKDYQTARIQFIGETLKLIRLKLVKIVPVKIELLTYTWSLIEKHHIYQADALQIASAKRAEATDFLTGDKKLAETAAKEGLNATYLG